MNKRCRPTETRDFLLNPHKGCATFQRFNGDPLFPGKSWSESGPTEFPPAEREVAEGYLPCTVAYCRWFWDLLQPEPNRFNWEPVEKALETAHERGQTLQVRLMPHGSHGQPQLPKWYQDRYPTVPGTKKSRSYIAAVYDGPEFIEQWGDVILEFGERFDGHPDLESVDMSYIGPWGEGAGDCSEEAIDRITEIYREAHPRTPLLAMISGYKMKAGVRAGAGWRCDCYGDLGIWFNPQSSEKHQWNHTYDCYPREVCEQGAQDAWKTAPVVFETCSVPMTWYEKGFDIDFILQQGLKFHGSVLMPKSAALPEEWMPKLREFCNDMGYRFVIRQFQFDGRVKKGASFEYGCWIENVGVAPVYRQYTFAIRLTQGNRSHIFRSSSDILEWLPGDVFVHETVPVPDFFEPGKIMLHAGLIDPETETPRVRFAVEESDEDGWVMLDTVELVVSKGLDHA
jgi:hypothetical protein